MNILVALILVLSSITIYKIAYSKAPFMLRLFWVLGLIVAVRSCVLQ